jgi:hypothetical protein
MPTIICEQFMLSLGWTIEVKIIFMHNKMDVFLNLSKNVLHIKWWQMILEIKRSLEINPCNIPIQFNVLKLSTMHCWPQTFAKSTFVFSSKMNSS